MAGGHPQSVKIQMKQGKKTVVLPKSSLEELKSSPAIVIRVNTPDK
jgi:hypothetical protein